MANNGNEMKIPNHLAIILDGNGRWARKQGLIRSAGHQEGAKRLKEIIQAAFEWNIRYLSIFAFSTENWKRPKEEIEYLFSLPKKFFDENLTTFIERDWKVIFSGDLSKLPISVQDICFQTMLKTRNCHHNVLNICFNYGSHDELAKACREIAEEYKAGAIKKEEITPACINRHLYTKELPPVDFLIRTSNEKRISNFLLWQIAYAEIYFTKTLWPMFTKKELKKALDDYAKRDRRFGGIHS